MKQETTQTRRTPAEWLEIVREGCRGLLSAAQWCRKHQIPYPSFKWWKSRFEKEGLLEDLYRQTPLITGGEEIEAVYALPISHRGDIRLMLFPLTPGSSPQAVLTAAWSGGAAREDGVTYVFADGTVRNIYLFRWEANHFTDTVIRLDKGCRIKWAEKDERGGAQMVRKDLVNLLKIILPHIAPPGENAVKMPVKIS